MKRIITALFFCLSLMSWPMLAQDIDESYVFMDDEGNIIENGATVVRNVVEPYDDWSSVIYSGLSVLNLAGSDDEIKMHYVIKRIDNGTYQICFPTTCNMQTAPGEYETGTGKPMSDLQDIQSEWFPTAEGECVVDLTIELFTKQGLFPPTYVHKAWGPSITLRFVNGAIEPEIVPGDVNGDKEVNISDINALIDIILSGAEFSKPADVNNDNEIGISDVNALIDMILSAD